MTVQGLPTALPLAPPTPFARLDQPSYGQFEGMCASTALRDYADKLGLSTAARLAREKKWQWFAVADSELAIGGAIVQTGYAGKVFFFVIDRQEKRCIHDQEQILPPGLVQVFDEPDEGSTAKLWSPMGSMHIRRGRRRLHIEGRFGELALELAVETFHQPAMTAIAPVTNAWPQGTNITQKQMGLRAEGKLHLQGHGLHHFDVEDSFACLDYSHGLMARFTHWTWACGSGTARGGELVGLNFIQDFNQDLENALWIDGKLRRCGPMRIDFHDDRPLLPWQITSADESVELQFEPRGYRVDRSHIPPIVSSHYMQPWGCFSGRVLDLQVEELFGICEDHSATW